MHSLWREEDSAWVASGTTSSSNRNQQGFSLVEIIIATAVLLIVMGMAMTGLLHAVAEQQRASVQNELDIDVQKSMERLKYDMRLTSQDQMYFYPEGSGPYTAISFPQALDSDGDGVVEVDSSTGKLQWDRQIVYHVWSGDPTQLRRTIFNTRTNLTGPQRQAQLNSVVTNGNGNATYESSGVVTEVLFENLFTWSLTPRTARFDGYADTLQRSVGTVMGSCIVTSGVNTFKFSLVGKNASSSGYKVGVDTLVASPSYSVREGEAQISGAATSGTNLAAQYMSGGSWSGNYQLYFPATATGQYFTLSIENDRWEETNFQTDGASKSNTTVVFDTSLSPQDYLVCLDGNKTNWLAASQTGTNGASYPYDYYRGCAVRVLVKGWQMDAGGWIDCNGGKCRVNFRPASGVWAWNGSSWVECSLQIDKATIAQCSSDTNTSMDATGTVYPLTFNGGNTTVELQHGVDAYSDYAALPIDRTKSYLVSFLVNSALSKSIVYQWGDSSTGAVHAFMIPASAAPTATTLSELVWSSKTNVVSLPSIPAVQCMFVAYATNGVYTSGIFDTHVSAPAYSTMTWSNVIPTGASLSMKVRTGSAADMSDATGWSTCSVVSAGSISPGSRRYVQFQSTMTPDSTCLNTPKLQSVTIRWPGEAAAVDVGGVFTKGPDYGIFEMQQIGSAGVLAGVFVNLQIFEDVRVLGSMARLTSGLSTEIRPRNTGR